MALKSTIDSKDNAEVVQNGQDLDAEEATTPATIDPILEKKLVRKLDAYIIPVYMVTYMISFIDRVNIGNANVAGLSEDLGLEGAQFNGKVLNQSLVQNCFKKRPADIIFLAVAVSIFYVTYVLCEIPLTVLLKIVGPSRLIPTIMLGWSIITICSGFLQNYGGLIACRLLLGVFESALFPSLNLYISMFWKRQEIAKRAILLLVSMALAGAFAGLLAYGLVQMHGIAGQAGWRWMFYIEGILSFLFGIAAFWLFPDNPETAYFLSPDERQLGKDRLISQGNYEEYSFNDVKAAFKSPICWLSGLIQICACTQVYSMTTFLPAIINGLGFTGLEAQYLTIPLYITGAIGVFTAGWLADRYQRRAPILLTFSLSVVVGYAILLGTHSAGVNYYGCFMVVFASYVFPGLNLTWLNGNTAPHYKRATAIAMNQTIANLGGVIAGQIYMVSERPYYTTGHAVSLTGIGLAWSGTWVMWWLLKRRNESKERGIARGETDNGRGDESVEFKYQI